MMALTDRSANASSLWSLFLMTCGASLTGTLVERLTTSKVLNHRCCGYIKGNEGIKRLKVYRPWKLYKVAGILYEGFQFSGKGTEYLVEKTNQAILGRSLRFTNLTFFLLNIGMSHLMSDAVLVR
jgi:hypothetical protein